MFDLFKRKRVRIENEFLASLPRYLKTTNKNFDTSKYFVNYSHKDKVLTLKSKQTGKNYIVYRKDILCEK